MNSDLLLTFAEVAVAFAGFASLVAILGERPARDDPHINSVRMRAMVLYSLMVVMFSLLPLLLHRYEIAEAVIWRASSGALAVAVGCVGFWLTRAVLAVRSSGPQTGSAIAIAVAIPIPTLLAATLLLAANATTTVFVKPAAVYLTGLGLLVFLSGFAFSLVVFSFLGHIGKDD